MASFPDNPDKVAEEDKAIMDLIETMGWHWHQLDHMHIICSLVWADDHACTFSVSFSGQMLILMSS